MSVVGSSVSIASTIFTYFSPSKSPFYAVIAFGAAALVLSCQKIGHEYWWWIAIPIYVVLILAFVLSRSDRPTFEKGQHEEQLRFARSFGISSALLALVLTARAVDKDAMSFWLNYGTCLAQTALFLVYAWTRSLTEEDGEGTNFVQFALITTTFLVGASYSISEYVGAIPKAETNTTQPVKIGDTAIQYLIVALGLYLLWLASMILWARHLASLIRVEIPHPEGGSK